MADDFLWNSIFFRENFSKNDVDEIAEIVRMFTVHLSYHYFGIFTRSLNQLESNKILKFQKSNGWRVFSRPVQFFYSNFTVLVRRCFLGPVLVQRSLISSMSLGQRLNKKRVLLKLQALWCGSVVASRDALGMRQIVDPQNRPNWILIWKNFSSVRLQSIWPNLDGYIDRCWI